MLCSAKVQSNAESSVGLLTFAGRSARILVTSTRDLGRIFTCMHDVKFDGKADFLQGIQKAQLALKHRGNSLQRQRIVAFVSSPLSSPVEDLVKLAKKLKKNNVAVDVVNVGVEGDNIAKIDAFIEAVNSGENSRALHVAAGGQTLADALMGSDIYLERDGTTGAGGDGGGDGGEFPYNVDPAADPELAEALRLSMVDMQRSQAAANEAEGGNSGESGEGATGGKEGKYEDNDEDLYGTGEQMDVDNDEDEELRRAIELSKAEAEASGAGAAKEEDEKKGS